MSDAYFADPQQISTGYKLLNDAAVHAAELAEAFGQLRGDQVDWTGWDSWGRAVRPDVAKEFETILNTVTAISEAVTGIERGVYGGLQSINQTQEGIITAIHESTGGPKH
ncbi:hypothetical protein [Streptomyces sp. NPDC059215]|uniref:hypothetical protein n=1 Tax=Streptomyces sp. NPDC059215 TaxID=3346772 RepID=UPI0036ABB129